MLFAPMCDTLQTLATSVDFVSQKNAAIAMQPCQDASLLLVHPQVTQEAVALCALRATCWLAVEGQQCGDLCRWCASQLLHSFLGLIWVLSLRIPDPLQLIASRPNLHAQSDPGTGVKKKL